MSKFAGVAYWLLAVGGLNWGLKLFKVNLVESLLIGINLPVLINWVYGLVGLAGVYAILVGFKIIKGR